MSSEVCGKCTVHTLNSTLVTGQTEFPPTHTHTPAACCCSTVLWKLLY